MRFLYLQYICIIFLPGAQGNATHLLDCQFISCPVYDACLPQKQTSCDNVTYLVCSSGSSYNGFNNLTNEHIQLTLVSAFTMDPSAKFELNISVCHPCVLLEECSFSREENHFTSTFQNQTYCCSDDVHDLFVHNPCYPHNLSCKHDEAENHQQILELIKIPYLMCGLISVIGNFIVIFQKIKGMYTQNFKHKEIQIFNLLVLNLSLADLLMGIYVLVLSTIIVVKEKSSDHFIEFSLCNVLGVMNFASSQISVTNLVLISTFRWYSVKFPYKRVSLRLAYFLVVGTWVVWIVLAVIPLIPVEPFDSFFKYGVRIDEFGRGHDLHLVEPEGLLKSFLRSLRSGSEYDEILNTELSPTKVIDILHHLGLVNSTTHIVETLGYYNLQPVCSVNLILSDHQTKYSYFTLVIILYNFFSFLVILIFYAIILKSMTDNGDGMACNCLGLIKNKKKTSKTINKPSQRRYFENKSMFKRVVFIVATDFICWVPICLISLSFLIKGFTESTQMCNATRHVCSNLDLYHKLQIAVFFVIPVNSSINPYVYSFHFWKGLFLKLKSSIGDLCVRLCKVF